MKSLYITMQASAAAILLLLLRRLETLTIHINSVLTGGEEHGQIIPEIFNALQDKSLVRLNISFAMEVQTNVTAEMLDPLRASTNLKRLLITHNFLEMENISLHHVLPVSSPIKSLHRGEGLHIEFELDIVLSIDDVGGGGNGLDLMAVITPYMVDPDKGNLGPKVFFVWGTLCTCACIYAYFLVPETKGLSLEQVDKMLEEVNPRNSAGWKPTTTFANEMGLTKGGVSSEEIVVDVEKRGSVH
ncbi:hypothetical protein JADG_008243 [Aureobasidium aubasidani]|nr:hypothetical protein JADG_008243 [Aureobasidium pullulans]